MTFQPKLTSAEMTKIRVMRKYGMTLKVIAEEFGVSIPAIFYALQRLERR